jgi:atypical dual specificity phosphatase
MNICGTAEIMPNMILNVLRKVGLIKSQPTLHLAGRLLACAFPRESDLLRIKHSHSAHVINLTEKPHEPALLMRLGVYELHLPVKDFHAPSYEQVNAALAYMAKTSSRVAVHCKGGLGRTGTLIACLYVAEGLSADEAIRRVRAERPGAIETRTQLDAIRNYHYAH